MQNPEKESNSIKLRGGRRPGAGRPLGSPNKLTRPLRELAAFCNAAEYQMVHRSKVRKVWRLHDGLPLQGQTVTWFPKGVARTAAANAYPTRTPLDAFIEAVVGELPKVTGLVGHAGRDWTNLTVAPWVYPVGSALSLHQDGSRYSGAYTFFVHPYWNLYWGGWLTVLDPATRSPRDIDPDRPWLDDASEDASIWNPGLGTVILPKPNRLVFMGPEAQHLISRVDANAGMKPRVSIAGFFRKDLNSD